MKPEDVMRAADLLEALEGLARLKKSIGNGAEEFELAMIKDRVEGDHCRCAAAYLDIETGTLLIKIAAETVLGELQKLGVDMTDEVLP